MFASFQTPEIDDIKNLLLLCSFKNKQKSEQMLCILPITAVIVKFDPQKLLTLFNHSHITYYVIISFVILFSYYVRAMRCCQQSNLNRMSSYLGTKCLTWHPVISNHSHHKTSIMQQHCRTMSYCVTHSLFKISV